jgi:hypothetical protein
VIDEVMPFPRLTRRASENCVPAGKPAASFALPVDGLCFFILNITLDSGLR